MTMSGQGGELYANPHHPHVHADKKNSRHLDKTQIMVSGNGAIEVVSSRPEPMVEQGMCR